MTRLPHFVLFSRSEEPVQPDANAGISTTEHEQEQGGSWFFRILKDDGSVVLEASDFESQITRDRLELLAVVRGLEAFEQPSSVTLITPNPQISRSVRQGLEYWRDRDWMWERFGEKVRMRNSDLWIRIDRAIQIHDVQCRTHRIDPPSSVPRPKMHLRPAIVQPQRDKQSQRTSWLRSPVSRLSRLAAKQLRGMAETLSRFAPEASTDPI